MKQNGHSVEWIELPGVGHKFDQKTLPDTWTWLQSKTLCGKTTPGSCGPGPPPSPQSDYGVPPPRTDGGLLPPPPVPAPGSDAGAPLPHTDSRGPADPESDGTLQLQRNRPADLLGGCSTSRGSSTDAGGCVICLLFMMVALELGRRQ
jgi:hypothetical protein